RGGAGALRQGPRLQRRPGQRVLASRIARHRGVLRSAAIPDVLARGRTARRSILSASAQSFTGIGARLRRTRLAARTELGVPCRDRGTRATVDRQRLVRRGAATADHSRPPRRGAAVLSVAYRQSEFLDEGAAQIRCAQTGGGLFPRQLP